MSLETSCSMLTLTTLEVSLPSQVRGPKWERFISVTRLISLTFILTLAAVRTLLKASRNFPLLLIILSSWLIASKTKGANLQLRSIPLFSFWGVSVSLPVRRILESCAAGSGIWTAYGVSEGLTRLLKGIVWRRRPNFYALCHFDADTMQCMGTLKQICQAQYSFPSGHSSLSACTMVFLCCYLCGRVQHSCYRCIACTLFISWALFVASTRVHDHWHNPSDVLAGLLVGTLSALGVYRIFYPPLFSKQAGIPKSIWALTVAQPGIDICTMLRLSQPRKHFPFTMKKTRDEFTA